MRHLGIAILALVLTGGAIASARAARVDPPYDDDRFVRDQAEHEFRLSDETDVTVPLVRCSEPATRYDEPHQWGSSAIILGRHHLGVEGREVMALSSDPASDLAAHTSGTTILPLAAELELQDRIESVRGRKFGRADLYVDESMPFSALQAVTETSLLKALVVRDAETSRLRIFPLSWGRHHSGNMCVRRLVVDDRRVVSDEGVELLSLEEGRPDFSTLAASVHIFGWDVGIHVTGNVPVRIVAAIFAVFETSCSGGTHHVFLEMHAPDGRRSDPGAHGRSCSEVVPVFGGP